MHISRELLLQWLNFECDEETERFIEGHLENCESCSEVVNELQEENDFLEEVPKSWNADSGALGSNLSVGGNGFSEQGSVSRQEFSTGISDMRQQNGVSVQQNRWQPETLYASGGIGEIWKAFDTLLGRTVALKKLKPTTAGIASIQTRFLTEARITAQLQHPGTVTIMDLIDDGPRSYYVMTLVHGQPLSVLINQFSETQLVERKLDRNMRQLIRYWIAVARTIAYAHSKQVLHRDLKSENVLVGDFGQVTVIDWGLAKLMNEPDEPIFRDNNLASTEDSPSATLAGQRLGTPCFMAPEQASGYGHLVDYQTDVWGLGAMLYEILSGSPPFNGLDSEEVVQAIVDSPVPNLRDTAPSLPAGLCNLCMSALKKDKNDRPRSAMELADSVEQWLHEDATQRQSAVARQKLFELSGELIFIFDYQSKIVWGNAAWEKQLGWKPEQWIGKSSESLVHPDDLMREEDKQRVRDGETVVHQIRNLHRDGTFHWYSWHFTAVPDEGHVYAIGIRIDDQNPQAIS